MSTITRKLSTEVTLSSTQKWTIATIWLGIALISTLAATLFSLHQQLEVNLYRIFDLSFYYFTPAVLWTLLTPLICRLTDSFPLAPNAWQKNLLRHFLYALVLAPFTRFGALLLDFSIKYMLGMIDPSPFVIVMDVYLVGIASIPKDIFNYFLVIGIYSLSKQERKDSDVALAQLSIRQGRQYLKLALAEIYWIQAAGNYVLIFTADRSYRIRRTIKQLEVQLAPAGFQRVHRSFLVNAQQVESMSHWRSGEYLIQMKNKKRLTSSRTYLSNIKKIKTV